MGLLSIVPLWGRLLFLAVLALTLVGGGWKARGAYDDANTADERIAQAEAKSKADAQALANLVTLQTKLSAQSATYLNDLERKDNAIKALRSSVAAGAVLVRVNGTACGGMPQAPSVGRLDPPAGAVLTPSAGQDVLDLRAGVERLEHKLAACQVGAQALSGQ